MLARKMELRMEGGWWNEDNIVAAAEMSTVIVRRSSSAARQLWASGQMDAATRPV